MSNLQPKNQLSYNMAIAILSVSLLLGFIANLLFLGNKLGIQFVAITILIVTFANYISLKLHGALKDSALVYSVITVILASMVAIRASSALTTINILATITSFGLLLETLYLRHSSFGLRNYAKSVLYPFFCVGSIEFVNKALKLKPTKTVDTPKKDYSPVIRGSIAAFILVLIFGTLFAMADEAFSGLLGNLPSISISHTLFGRALLSIIVAVFLVGVFAYGLLRNSLVGAATKPTTAKVQRVELLIVLGALNGLFLLFVAIQSLYLFGGQDAIEQSTTLTYAEYARRGFFELLAVAFGVAITVFTLNRLHKMIPTPTKDAVFQLANVALIAQTGIIIVSAIKRLSLYEAEFGFTGLRFYSHAFIFVLAGILVLLGLHILYKITEVNLLKGISGLLFGYVLILNIINPDSFIAAQNIDHYRTTGKLDAAYISGLSEDATAQKIVAHRIIKAEEDIPAGITGEGLLDRRLCALRTNTTPDTLPELHFGRIVAQSQIQDYLEVADCIDTN